MPIGEYALNVQPRYNFHVGDESPTERRHEVLFTVGFNFIPLRYKSKN